MLVSKSGGEPHCFTESLMDCDQAILTHPDRSEIILLTIFRTGVLRAAERQQSKLPWSRPPHAEHAKALKLAAYLAEAEGVSAEAVYNAACAHALAASAAESDGERKQREDKAMDFLARIAKQGYFRNVLKKNELLTDPDLNSLRHRADFNDLSHATSPAQ